MYRLPEPIRQAIEAGRAPSPPQVLLRLLQMVDDDCTTIAELARLVEQDPGLCTRVLTAANSPAIRRGGQLRSIESCLVALGTRLVRSIATCLSVQSLFDERSANRVVDLAGFWTHSLLAAELSRSLAAATGYARPDEAYLAGLLHDVGELILLSAIGEPYLQMLAMAGDEKALAELESGRFGAHHGEIGTWLADQWHLDSSFADGILFHHLPGEQIITAGQLAQVVWIAHELACADTVPEELIEIAGEIFGNPLSQRLGAIRDQAAQRMCVIADAIGMTPDERPDGGSAAGLPRVLARVDRPVPEAGVRLATIIGDKALLQPLQENLFAIDSDTELLLALRESARILFELNHVAFLRLEPGDGRLTGKGIPGQPPLFGQLSLVPEVQRSVAVAAIVSDRVCSSFEDASANSLLDVQFARALNSSGLLCIPMSGRSRTTGVIVAGLSAGQHARLHRRWPCLANFGRIAGISLESWQEARSVGAQAEESASARFTRRSRRIAHEAGNPLTIIKGYLKILDGKLPPETGARQELAILSEEIERVASILRRLSELPDLSADAHAVDICELVRELLLLYRAALFDGRGIALETVMPAEAIRINCDRDSLKQILVNLWKNASEALSSGHRLRLTITDDILHQGQRFAELRLEDNGPGMSEETISALHRPGSARIGGPRGMGLSIVGSLAQRLGVPVSCRSKPGVGTMMSFLLPTATFAETRDSTEIAPR
ncbi:HDOD domain-containing protein [Accumulibacter sp.]|uniref:HDOD domain-containing protein n=1 Tax=Accumulibacter sp. TaxID=2053492 RepID=UPI0025F39922|nr:HDOD domain-containing protein [Accumulibacter sp.]MCM8595270.1 HDOD domain-containing protein [Accumulibacter sp.]MDS4049416.1 HDOD domain-containing protein [Accumulibacter sp.]